MNEDIKSEWVSALRSGDYKQGIGYLRVDNEFCCLGVLCDIAVNKGVITYSIGTDNIYNYGWPGSRAAEVLPDAVVSWAELEDQNPSAGSLSLAEHNDDGVPFSGIADLIEEWL